MQSVKVTKMANYEQQADVDRKISEALDTLVRCLQIEAGSFKVYVHQGKWSPRIEIQKNLSREVRTK